LADGFEHLMQKRCHPATSHIDPARANWRLPELRWRRFFARR
jgi:hypothetical protein